MTQKLDSQYQDTLLASERRSLVDPDRVLALLPLRPYHVVADIGGGMGAFALPLAKYLYDGKLYAVAANEETLTAAKDRLGKFRFANVEFVKGAEDFLPLPKISLDGALLAFVLHETTDRKGLLTAAAGLLRRGGWLAVLEWAKQESPEGPPVDHRLSKEEVRDLASQAGLRFASERSLSSQQYLLLFRL